MSFRSSKKIVYGNKTGLFCHSRDLITKQSMATINFSVFKPNLNLTKLFECLPKTCLPCRFIEIYTYEIRYLYELLPCLGLEGKIIGG